MKSYDSKADLLKMMTEEEIKDHSSLDAEHLYVFF